MDSGSREVNGESVLPFLALVDHHGLVDGAEALLLQEEQPLGRLLLLGIEQVLNLDLWKTKKRRRKLIGGNWILTID